MYTIEYRNTHSHSNADGLSRLPMEEKTDSRRDVASKFNLVQMATVPLTHIQLRTATRNDRVLSKVLEFTRKGWPSKVPEELKPYARRSEELTVVADCLLLGNRVFIPMKHRNQLLQELHDTHPGICRMKALGRSYIWWPGLDQDIEKTAKSCLSCAEIKTSPPVAPLHQWVWPEKPWRRIHVDFACPLFNKMYLLIVDAHSKWPEIWEMKSTSAARTVEVLTHLFSLYGLPEQVVSDNGPQFVASEFANFLSKNGVKHYRSAPYHPATNGAVERLVKSFKQAMKIGQREGENSQETLVKFLMKYRSTPHAVTATTPAELFLNRPMRTKFDLLKPDIQKIVRSNQAKQKQYHDQKGKSLSFVLGQEVLMRFYRSGQPRWSRGIISKVLGSRSFLVDQRDGILSKRHTDQLKAFSPSQTKYAMVNADSDMDLEELPEGVVPRPRDTLPLDTEDMQLLDTAVTVEKGS